MSVKMKLILPLVVAGLLISCQRESGTKISVEIDKVIPLNGLVVLYAFEEGGLVAKDTLEMIDSTHFETVLKIDKETFYRVDIFRMQQSSLILDGSEKSIKVKFSGSEVTLDGSEKSQWVKEIDDLMAESEREVQQLNMDAGRANEMGDQAALDALINLFNTMQMNTEANLKVIIRKANPSLAAMYGLNFLNLDTSFGLFDSVITATNLALPDHFWVNEIKKGVEKARTLALGQNAPDFQLETPSGELFSLSELKGKYVLIDFWAAWCRPCRAENPNVVRMYNKYKNEQFEILGVSLDKTKEAWVQAIEIDGLLWKHVSDLKYFDSEVAKLYGINAIPATYLIDPNGVIIDKNLRGPSLEARLDGLFGR